jgi:hypothetical protein
MIGQWLTPEGAWFFFITLYFVFYATAGGILAAVSASRRLAVLYLIGACIPLAAAAVGRCIGGPASLFGAGALATFLLGGIGAWNLKRIREPA